MSKSNFIETMFATYKTQDEIVNVLKGHAQSGIPEAFLDLQVFLNAMGREEESFAVSSDAIAQFPNDPRVLFNRGWHLLKRGRLQEGLAHLEHGRDLKTYGHLEPLGTRFPFWTQETGKGRRVHLVLEGGFGDEIIHFRFGKILKEKYGCHVNVICSPGLATVFAREPWVSSVLQREAALGVLHDCWLPGMSAALALGLEYKDIPDESYLRPDPERKKIWKSFLGGTSTKKKIGIRWAGNPQFEHQQLRQFDPQMLLQFADNPNVQLYSFQRDNDLISLPENVIDLGPQLKDWEDTAAALTEMDLVISSCTSVAHMSAALGCPTWVIVPALPYFIWSIPGETSPWYKSARVFRQEAFGDWQSVTTQLQKSVGDFLSRSAS